MGQQQLFIITLVLLIIALASYSGIRLMNSYKQSHDRELIIHRMNILVAEGKKFAAAPRFLGGGEGEFTGFSPAANSAVTSEFRIYTTAGPTWVLFVGYGTATGWNNEDPVQVTGEYDYPAGRWKFLISVN